MAKQYPPVPDKSAVELKKIEAAIEKGLGKASAYAEALEAGMPVLSYSNGSKTSGKGSGNVKSYIGNSKGDKTSSPKNLDIKGKGK